MNILSIPSNIIYKPFQFMNLVTRDVLACLFEHCLQKMEEKALNPFMSKQLALLCIVCEIQVTFALLIAFALPSKLYLHP